MSLWFSVTQAKKLQLNQTAVVPNKANISNQLEVKSNRLSLAFFAKKSIVPRSSFTTFGHQNPVSRFIKFTWKFKKKKKKNPIRKFLFDHKTTL